MPVFSLLAVSVSALNLAMGVCLVPLPVKASVRYVGIGDFACLALRFTAAEVVVFKIEALLVTVEISL